MKKPALTPGAGPAVFDTDRSPAYWLLLIGVPVLLALIAILRMPLSVPMPQYLDDARQYVSTGHITDTSVPLEFAWLTALSMKVVGGRGPELLQALLYVGIVLSVWALARRCGATARLSLAAAGIAALYPQLPVSVTKIWDLELAVLLMVLLMLLTVALLQAGPRLPLAIAAGAVFGLSLAQRPNMLLLLPLPVWFCFASTASWRRKLLAFVAAGAVALLALASVNTIAHGSFFVSQNGAYNLVQGHNEFTVQVMLQDQSCEPTIGMILRADGIDPFQWPKVDPKAQQRYYIHRALTYIRSHPLEEVVIAVVKLWTIFRPNTRIHQGLSLITLMIVGMSLIFPAWLILLGWRYARGGLDRLDWTFIAAVGLYVLPFLITAGDPRYQIPIEIALLSHMARILSPARPVVTLQQSGG